MYLDITQEQWDGALNDLKTTIGDFLGAFSTYLAKFGLIELLWNKQTVMCDFGVITQISRNFSLKRSDRATKSCGGNRSILGRSDFTAPSWSRRPLGVLNFTKVTGGHSLQHPIKRNRRHCGNRALWLRLLLGCRAGPPGLRRRARVERCECGVGEVITSGIRIRPLATSLGTNHPLFRRYFETYLSQRDLYSRFRRAWSTNRK